MNSTIRLGTVSPVPTDKKKAGDIKMSIQKSIKKTMALVLVVVMMISIMPLTGASELETTPVEIETDVSPPADPPEDNIDNETPNDNPDTEDSTAPEDEHPENVLPEIDLNTELTEDPDDITASFTDPNFLAVVRLLADKPTDPILKSDVDYITNLNVFNKNITSLAGIEHFTALRALFAGNNKLTTLDVSNNTALQELDAPENQLTSLDVGNNTALSTLSVWRNQLATLDVSNNINLISLTVSENKLTTIDVDNNTALIYLTVWGNQLTSLDVGNNTALTYLSVSGNKLTTLDVDSNTALTTLYASDNQLTSLNVSNNTALIDLSVRDNKLANFDVSKNTALIDLIIGRNQLTTLNVSANTSLERLYAYENQLTTFDVSNNAALLNLDVSHNQLTTLDISNKPNLENVYAHSNYLTSINITNTPKLEYLNVQQNNMNSESDVIGLAEAWANSLKEFLFRPQRGDDYISGPPTVTFENWDGTVLATFQVERGSSVTPPANPSRTGWKFTRWAAYNPMDWWETYADMKNIWEDVTFVAQFSPNTDRNIRNAEIPDANLRWAIRHSLGIRNDKAIRLSDISKLVRLDTPWNNISDLTGINLATSLRILECSNNNLSTLDLSSNPAIKTVRIGGNRLSSINLQNNINLTSLDAGFNRLNSIDLAGAPKLRWLYLNNNNLTELNVQHNRDLFLLHVHRNFMPNEDAITGLKELTDLDNYRFDPQNEAFTGTDGPITIPDHNFRRAIETFLGKTPGAEILKSEVYSIGFLNIPNRHIESLAGLEYFQLLEVLYCYGNDLTSIDLSQNPLLTRLDSSANQLTALDVSSNPLLTNLNSSNNYITSLDLSSNTNIDSIQMGVNRLTTLDVSSITELYYLGVEDNRLTSLDISANTKLQSLYAGLNQLTALDVSNNTVLQELYVNENRLTTLNLSNNTALRSLYINNNQLTTLDLSNNTLLVELFAHSNNLTTLDLSNNLRLWGLNIRNNQLTTLDVRNNRNLGALLASNNEITSVILSSQAYYWTIDLRQNRMANKNAIIGRSDIRWDSKSGGWTPFLFSPQKTTVTHGISLNLGGTHNFDSAAFGYTNQTPLSVRVTSTGNSPSGEITIALSGTNADSFTLSTMSLPSIAAGSSHFFTVVPKTELPIGTYTAIVTVGGELAASRSFVVRFAVTKLTGPAAPSAPTTAGITLSSVTLNVLPDLEYAMSLTGRTPGTGWKDSGTFNELAQNTTYFFFARVKETDTHFASVASAPLSVTTKALPVSISITPVYSRATVGQTIDLELKLPQDVEPDSISWNVDSDAFTVVGGSLTTDEIKLTVIAPNVGRQAVSVAATFGSAVYRAQAQVDVVEETPTTRTAKLADNTVEINRAKKAESRYVEVPIVLNYTPADSIVKLYSNYDTNRVEITDVTAELNGDGTAIVLNTTRNTNVKLNSVTAVIGNDVKVRADGTLNISVIERFPQKLTVRADQLDLFYMNDTGVILVDSDGEEYEATKIALRGNSAIGKISADEKRVELRDDNIRNRTGNIPVRVTVDPGDYTTLKRNDNRNIHDISIKVVNNTPSLRLSASTVTLLDDKSGSHISFTDAATIRLLTRNVRIPFESFYEIEKIESVRRTGSAGRNDILVNVNYTSGDGFGEVSISPRDGETARAGRTNLRIYFKYSDKTVDLPLTVRVFNPRNLNPSPSSRTVTVNASHAPGTEIVTLPINLNAADLVIPDWQIVSVGGKAGSIAGSDLDSHIDFKVDGNNMITFSVLLGADLNGLLNGATSRSIQVRIGSNELNSMSGKQRTVAVTLRIVSADASFTISQRGRIDIANPESAIDATIKLQNTSERILGVTLMERTDAAGNQIIPTEISKLFDAVHIPGENTFKIIAIGNIAPRVRYSLAIEVELESGKLTSWNVAVGTGKITHKPNLNITPVQTTSKAWRSADNVTLRAAMPHTGDDIQLNLTTPANVKLGHVNIQQASLANLYFIKENGTPIPDALIIEQNGASSWTISFRDGEVPWGTTNKAGKETPLKSNYNIRLELWAEGTYVLDDDGNPTALGSGKAASRPTLVTVKVNIRP